MATAGHVTPAPLRRAASTIVCARAWPRIRPEADYISLATRLQCQQRQWVRPTGLSYVRSLSALARRLDALLTSRLRSRLA